MDTSGQFGKLIKWLRQESYLLYTSLATVLALNCSVYCLSLVEFLVRLYLVFIFCQYAMVYVAEKVKKYVRNVLLFTMLIVTMPLA